MRVAADDALAIVKRAGDNGINLLALKDGVGISADELTTPEHIETVWRAFGEKIPDFESISPSPLPEKLLRRTLFCSHPIFNRHHTEQKMTRYLRRLAGKDIALNRSMIPLGMHDET